MTVTVTATATDRVTGLSAARAATFTVTGTPGLVGAYVSPAAFGAGTATAQALAAWAAVTGRPLTVRRVYFGPAGSPNAMPAAVTADLRADAAAGRKVCLSFRPPFAPPTAADAAALGAFLASCAAAGLRAEVALWAEPNNAGLTAAQCVAGFAFYGPTVRAHYPLVWNVSAPFAGNAAYYPGDAGCDVVAADLYCSEYLGGTRLDALSALAGAKPFGVWECNSSTDPAHGQSQAQAAAFFGYLRSFMAARLAAGLDNADVLLFSSSANLTQETPLTSAADYRVPMYQALSDTLSA